MTRQGARRTIVVRPGRQAPVNPPGPPASYGGRYDTTTGAAQGYGGASAGASWPAEPPSLPGGGGPGGGYGPAGAGAMGASMSARDDGLPGARSPTKSSRRRVDFAEEEAGGGGARDEDGSGAAGEWTKLFDEDAKSEYYYNCVTQQSVWERPASYSEDTDPYRGEESGGGGGTGVDSAAQGETDWDGGGYGAADGAGAADGTGGWEAGEATRDVASDDGASESAFATPKRDPSSSPQSGAPMTPFTPHSSSGAFTPSSPVDNPMTPFTPARCAGCGGGGVWCPFVLWCVCVCVCAHD